MIKGIQVVFMPSHDIEQSKKWYERNLGLNWNEWVMIVPNGAPIFFVESNDNWNYKDLKGNEIAVLSFTVEDALKLHRQLKDNGVQVEEQPRDIPGIGREFTFYDPSGNLLMATQPE